MFLKIKGNVLGVFLKYYPLVVKCKEIIKDATNVLIYFYHKDLRV